MKRNRTILSAAKVILATLLIAGNVQPTDAKPGKSKGWSKGWMERTERTERSVPNPMQWDKPKPSPKPDDGGAPRPKPKPGPKD